MSTFNISRKVSKLDDISPVVPANGEADIFTVPANKVYKISAMGLYLSTTVFGLTGVKIYLKSSSGMRMNNLVDLFTPVDTPTVNVTTQVDAVTSRSIYYAVFKQPLVLSEGQGLRVKNVGGGTFTCPFFFLGEFIENTL